MVSKLKALEGTQEKIEEEEEDMLNQSPPSCKHQYIATASSPPHTAGSVQSCYSFKKFFVRALQYSLTSSRATFVVLAKSLNGKSQE